MIRHDKIVEFLVKHINSSRKPKIVCKEEHNKYGSRMKPDLECEIRGKRILIDVSFVRHENQMVTRFREK